MNRWLAKFAKNPVGVGSVAPSSKALGKLMSCDIGQDFRVLELGPGTGALTSHILERIVSPKQLTLIEHDPEFSEICKKKFPGLDVRQTDAGFFLKDSDEQFDAIISGIPFVMLPAEKRAPIFKSIKAALKPHGIFVMFQYSPTTRNELKRLFGNVKTRFTPWNIPPAFVYTCTKQQ